MSKFIADQVVYTKGCSIVADGTKLTVASNYRGGVMVSCIDALKKYYFVNETQLVLTKDDVVDTKSKEVTKPNPVHDTKSKEVTKPTPVPAWLKAVGSTYLSASRLVYIYGFAGLPDHSIAYIADDYVYNMTSPTIDCIIKTKNPHERIAIPKDSLYVPVHSNNYPVKPTVKKPLASEFNDFTDDHKHMIELLKEPKRSKVIELTLKGVDIEQYEFIVGLKYFILIPKKPVTAYMPMIMAHTDIQANVSHPNENLEYDPLLDKFSSPRGLGADDRAGCYAINKILINHPGKFIVALFDEEEIGCIGSKDFAKSKDFVDVDKLASCYISIDRKRGYNGASQIATYGHDNKKLFDLMKQATGRATVAGSSTDCKALAAGSKLLSKTEGLACFNMSCGYVDEHTASESLYFKELQTVVTDFDCMVLSATELWTEKFLADKPKKTQTQAYGNYWLSQVDEIIEIDGEEHDEADIRTLRYHYHQTTGKAYEFNHATSLCKEFEKNTYVRLDTTCMAGGVYGGSKLTKDLYNILGAYTWIVIEVKGMNYDLQSECNTQVASNVPAAWLKMVLVTDPLIQTN